MRKGIKIGCINDTNKQVRPVHNPSLRENLRKCVT